MKNPRMRRFLAVLITSVIAFCVGTLMSAFATDTSTEPVVSEAQTPEDAVILTAEPVDAEGEPEEAAADTAAEDEDAEEEPFADFDTALEYVENYADNLESDPDFRENTDRAIEIVRSEIKPYATVWSLLPPVIAIVFALITKEVYSSLFLGILAGALLYSGGNFEGTITHIISDGFVASLADSYKLGIILFLIILGALVAMMNKAGGSAAFGRWAVRHIKSRMGAQLATIALGVLIFIDDYFNCLTVGSVMRPVTDSHKISRAKLSYLIDATAAPVCIIAPISSWAAAVAGFARSAGEENGIALFVKAIPYNYYALLTLVMMVFLAVTGLEFGPMKKHEDNARDNGDLFTLGSGQAVREMEVNEKGRVVDLIIPVAVLIICCVVGMIYSGGFFAAGEDKTTFITAFSDSDASIGLAYGGGVTLIFAVLYFLVRRVIKFKDIMESVPEGFKAMVPAIMILACAWTLKAMTDSLGAKIFVSRFIENQAADLQALLPAIIFLIAVGLSFATGTSWGTFGILIPIVLSVFDSANPIQIVAISACMAGAVCGDHCSPISDTTIMASAGAQCDHVNHVSTQLPYAMTVAAVSFVTYLISGFLPNWYFTLPIGIVLMIAALLAVKAISGKTKASK